MEATIAKEFSVSEPIDKVWALLSNPFEISQCVPGASVTEQIDDENFKGEVTLKFGPVKAKYAGDIKVVENDAESHRLVLDVKGLDSKGKGSAEMKMSGSAQSSNEGTQLVFKMEVKILGPLAQFGSRLINDVSSHILNQFIGNFEKMLAGLEVNNELKTGNMVGSMVKGIFSKSK